MDDQARAEARMAAQASAAMRAFAGTVTDAPPLRLPPPERVSGARPAPAPPARPRRPHRARWTAPLAAAVVVIAIAAILVAVHRSPAAPAAPGQRHTSAPVPTGPAPAPTDGGSISPSAACASDATATRSYLVPAYVVALCDRSPDSELLVVADTLTGAPLGQVSVPSGQVATGIYGSDDDATFVVTTTGRHASPAVPTGWDVLRIAASASNPATATSVANPVRLARLALAPPRQPVTGVAVSPDGTKVAIATQSPVSSAQAVVASLRVYSVATGALLGTWNAVDTTITAASGGQPPSGDVGMTLRWLSDGQHLAFAAGGSSIRLLDTRTPGSDLLANSTVLLPEHAPAATPSVGYPLACDLADGWSVSPDGTTVTCAAVGTRRTGTGIPTSPVAGQGCTGNPGEELGFIDYSPTNNVAIVDFAVSAPCASSTDSVALMWASADGGSVVGTITDTVSQQYGIFYLGPTGKFSPLLPLSQIAPEPG